MASAQWHEDELYERGLRIRREMFGPAGAEEQTDSATEFTAKLQDIVTRHCYGDIWARAGLDRRERSLVTLAFLVALGRRHEIGIHVEGAVANGVTVEEIRELLLQAVPYCGLPAAVDGFAVAERILAVPLHRTEPTPKDEAPMGKPSKLAHVVLQTNQLPALRDWYCTVLNAEPAFDNGKLAFLRYDDEHHRIGIVALDDYEEHERPAVGLQHISFTYESFEALLENYERLKAAGIRPTVAVNHGPTISIYYADPDRNTIETQVDVFETPEEVDDFMNGPLYQNNPWGTDLDPEDMLTRLRGGETFESLTARRS
ncbi:hypothetical protein GCM10027258_60000 [Amycolatopsis stemonae]